MTSAIDIESHPAAAFGFYQEFASLDGGWSTFPRHYLLYTSSGVFQLEVAQMQWLLPPQRAAWIAAFRSFTGASSSLRQRFFQE